MDRDGVINEMIYHQEMGIIDSPFIVEQFRLLPQVAEAISLVNQMGFKAVVVSNQPGIARGNFSQETLARIDAKMKGELAAGGAFLDAIYYCRHHPQGSNGNYRRECDCRKPKPGLLLQAAREGDIDLTKSFMIGDGLTDIQAGHSAGCKTILLGRMKCELCRLMQDKDINPDLIVPNLLEAVKRIQEGEL
jgi:D-glycero-D-manno-heptose 1,7-bisphosphate phosphatase